MNPEPLDTIFPHLFFIGGVLIWWWAVGKVVKAEISAFKNKSTAVFAYKRTNIFSDG